MQACRNHDLLIFHFSYWIIQMLFSTKVFELNILLFTVAMKTFDIEHFEYFEFVVFVYLNVRETETKPLYVLVCYPEAWWARLHESQEPRTQSRSPTWVPGPLAPEPSLQPPRAHSCRNLD